MSGNVKRYRKMRDLTQAVAAERAKIPFRTYQSVEYGDVWPEADTLQAVALALGVSAAHLLDDGSAGLPEVKPTPKSAPDLRDLLLALASLEDSQMRRYLDSIATEVAAARGDFAPNVQKSPKKTS